jgi:hypothetical protein
MAKGDDFQERRKHKRFKVAEGAFAVSPSYYNKRGQIKDISRGGLAFQYLGNNELSKSPLEGEIFLTCDDFCLRKIPVKTVLDFEVDTQIPFSSLPTRQSSIQFGKLSHNQKLLLDHFIREYTHK